MSDETMAIVSAGERGTPPVHYVFATVTPVFGLIALGYLAIRLGILASDTAKGLAAFVFKIALPAMLFRTMVNVAAPEAGTISLLAAFMTAIAATWIAATLASRCLLRRPPGDGAVLSMTAGFGNTVMMGIPLIVGHFGEAALAPLAALIAIHAPALWFVATVQIGWAERDRRERQSVPTLLLGLGRELAQNPIVVAIVLGSLWSLTDLGLAPFVDKSIGLLGQAGIPGALVALGMSLAQYEVRGQAPSIVIVTLLKLVFMPLVAWGLTRFVFELPSLWSGVIVVLAGCPTGVNAFLFASRFNRAVGTVSGAITLGTALSAITITIMLALLEAPSPT